MARDTLGEVEQLVLLAILRLDDEAYGVPIVEEILERTGRDVSRAAVYIGRRPFAVCNRWRIVLVLPAPRNPVMTVVGILPCWVI